MTSNFDHSSKNKLDQHKIRNGNPCKTQVIDAGYYSKNISIKRLIFQIKFSILCTIYIIRHVNKNDKVLFMLSFPELLLPMWITKKFISSCTFIDLWDTWPEALLSGRKNIAHKLFRKYCVILNKLFLPSASKIFYVSPSYTDWIIRYGGTLKNTIYIPLGFDEIRWSKFSKRISRNKVNRIVYVGYLADQFDLTESIKSIKDTEFTLEIIGDGYRLPQYRNLADNAQNIEFRGHLSFEQVEESLMTADLALLPFAEGSTAQMPNKLFDYLGARIPILVVGCSDAATFITERKFGWTAQNDCHDILRKLRAISNTDHQRIIENLNEGASAFSKKNIYKNLIEEITL